MRLMLLFLLLPIIQCYPLINLLRHQNSLISSLSPVHPKELSGSPTTKVLDIGCGNGQSTRYIHDLLKNNPNDITGIDKDEFKILKAIHKYPSLEFGIDDIRHSKLPSKEFDILFVSNVFQEIESRDFNRVIRHMNRISKNDSSLLYLYHNEINERLEDNMNIFYKNFNIIQTSIQHDNHYIIAKPKKGYA